ncbi:MAG: Integral rane sensor signal transduction histidine kinase [Pedosphaera sp.]|nr:Integral rane sensor signal transduction histidine kinase [Pedosphaera sp.]
MIKPAPIICLAILSLGICSMLTANESAASGAGEVLEIQSVNVNGKAVPFRHDGSVSLGAFPQNIFFGFGPNTNATRAPVRIRYKLEGYDGDWHESGGEMFFTVRFYNDLGDQISQNIFKVNGDSAGWNGSLEDSPLSHRRESVVVPAGASRVWVVISSAGPPATVGVYVVANLVVSKSLGNLPSVVLMQSPFDDHSYRGDTNGTPDAWTRDGSHPSMAKIVRFGQEPAIQAFAIVDEDPISHAEWRNIKEFAPAVAPGDHLVVEWNEMFSMGVGTFSMVSYDRLPPGNFQLHIKEVNVMGMATGEEASLAVLVPQPFWRTSWFWSVVLISITAVTVGGGRYVGRHKMRLEMQRLKNEQALEGERLRIAHDIHDDLGARVTQISLLSAVSQDNPAFPEKARADFDRISQMSRELVSALYQTVWAVNPENDNLDALVNYLCQMVSQLCERTQWRCRFDMLDLPREIQVSSQVRHNISMAVKEAVHNVIKHSKASGVTVRMAFNADLLTIWVEDDGCGFDAANHPAGNGLANMKRRLEDIGGCCSIESSCDHGTKIQIRVAVGSPSKHLVK